MVLVTPLLHQGIEAELQARLGPEAAVVCTGVDGDLECLWPEETVAVARAVLRRQREFAASRQAARVAMQRLGWPAVALPAHADRSPGWPDGLVGSISHTADTCLAVVGRKGSWTSIGIDLEPDQGIDEALWGIICRPQELRQLRALAPGQEGASATRVFVAKEAFYKWHFPQHRTFLDFNEVSVVWAPDGSSFEVAVHTLDGVESTAQGRGQLFTLGGQVVACFTS